ncbi:transglutaminase domain-containing protein [Micromonospora sp. WMMA1947]|uniref:transglutaminase domain-containing protein n=1 Tax=Micromonospora sp. WMMA1947 TaxID=3015163 RepID=UPI00248BAC0E|nr:transglutaminase domain-containing protein [Micromonospora sp. WMMA1947]WBC07641.1 transglutaminase domain-containing protein [Micromonospora sp. WMMA1947]
MTAAVRTPAAGLDRMLATYRRHTPMTEPGPHAEALRRLPADVPALVEVIGGLFAHYELDPPAAGWQPGGDRLAEVDLRTTRRMLDRVLALDPAPLTRARPLHRRWLGVCRDASLLLCAVLREQGVPARLRYGTAHHLYVPYRPMHDHVVVEYWSAAEGRWRYADGRMYRTARDTFQLPDHYRDDVPESVFLTGARAWRRAQEGERAALRLSGLMLNADAGRWQARNLFLYDLAALAGWEPLMWDAWGYIRRARPQARPRGFLQYRKLDRLAALDDRDPEQWRELLRRYRATRLVRVPARVLSCSPVTGRRVVAAPPARRTPDDRD